MKFSYYILLSGLLLLAACKKETEVESPVFKASVNKSTVKAGEPIEFSFEGSPGIITFYSGEVESEYAFKAKERIDQIKELKLSFETHSQLASGVPLTLMFSTDFNGKYNYADVNAATWQDITSRFTLAQPAVYPNGWQPTSADLTNLIVDGKLFYFAFKYDVPAYTATGSVPTRRWRAQKFNLESTTNYGLYQALALNTTASAGWQLVTREAGLVTPSSLAGNIVLFAPPLSTAPGFKDPMQQWAITKSFSADEVNMGVDRGLSIKSYQNPSLKTYEHTYLKAGKYKATFVAANTTVYGSKEIIAEIEINVIP